MQTSLSTSSYSGFRRVVELARNSIMVVVLILSAMLVVEPESDAAVSGQFRTSGGLCLDNRWGVTLEGNPVDIYACNGSAAQRWTAEDDGTMRVQTRCLMPQSNSVGPGVLLVTGYCSGSANQRWTYTAEGRLMIQGSDQCATNAADVQTNGNPVRLETCSGSSSQQWMGSV
ncbi:MAG: RICIN domain-containing protein, partial [Rhodococcus sp. (in: high G+C Gram-positive bacteria)]